MGSTDPNGIATFKAVVSNPVTYYSKTSAQMVEMGSQYRCNFSNCDCDWTTSGKMRWSLTQVIVKVTILKNM
jgi:hypothetical protein